MKIPYVEAKDSESDNVVQGFYFEYPETSYCFTEDYEREPKVRLVPCVMSHRMTDWGLPNSPIICKPIDKSTLRILGYIDTDVDYYVPGQWWISNRSEAAKVPIFVRNTSDTVSVWECSECGQVFKTHHQPGILDGTDIHYCSKCGTQFDWSEKGEVEDV